MSAIQATGQIRNYQITMGLILLTNIPIAYLLLKFGYPIYYVTIGFIIIEAISLVIRIFMAKQITGLMKLGYVPISYEDLVEYKQGVIDVSW